MIEEQSLISENKIEKNSILAEKWRFYVTAGSKSSLLIDSPITCTQSTETTFAGIYGYHELAGYSDPSIFRIRCNSIKL